MRGVLVKGEELLAARKRLGFTQDGLAQAARIDTKTIRKAERGERIDVQPLTRLAQTLGVELATLIVAEDSSPVMAKKRREVFLCWHSAWNDLDIERVLSVYHDDAVLHLPGAPMIPFGGDHCGKAEIGRITELVWATVPQERHPLDEVTILVSGDIVTVKGVTKIQMPDGKLYHLPSIMTFLFTGELVVDHDVHYDTLDFATRIQPPA
jgi:transcriptional regulator with XRE-family HTH domain